MSFTTTIPIADLVPKNSSFGDYYAEFNDAVTSAQRSLALSQDEATKHDTERATEHLSSCRQHMDEGAELLNSLEMELQTLAPQVRSSLRPYVMSARESLARNRSACRAMQTDLDAADDSDARVRLLSDADDRDRLRAADATADLEAASNSISQSRRNIAETESVGASILSDLQSQRATITRARQNLSAVDDGIDHSSSILSTMQRRAVVNRIILYVVGIAICIACVAVLYVRLFHPNEDKVPRKPVEP